MASKADPASRNRGIGFKIGDVFPADEPVARWTTVLAMATNNTIYLNVRLIEGDLPPELSTYYFRLLAAHFYEAATWLVKTRGRWPEIDSFVAALDADAQQRYASVVAFAQPSHPHHEVLKRSRVTLFHYPDMVQGKEKAGQEELANAMSEAKDLDGWIEGGSEYASFRATFADEIAVQLLSPSTAETEQLMEDLREPVFDLVKFTEKALYGHLISKDPNLTTVWSAGTPKPDLS